MSECIREMVRDQMEEVLHRESGFLVRYPIIVKRSNRESAREEVNDDDCGIEQSYF